VLQCCSGHSRAGLPTPIRADLTTTTWIHVKVHEALIEDHRKFPEGFVDIRDERIRESVRAQAARGAQWPDPRMSLNRSFESGGTVGDLAVTRVS
jgi:hypothetical protein